jgi:hypothetical protein
MKTERKYEIDWLRIILIFSVFLFHVGMIFNTWGWHIKNETQYPELKSIMTFLHYWRMPMLFFISGVGTYFALGKRSIGKYIKERSSRLLVPLLFGIFLLVPVQVYIERIDQYSSIWNYYTHMFDGVYPKGNFSWHHLWFLAYLFLASVILVPFINFYKSDKSKAFKRFITSVVQSKFGLYLFVIPLFLIDFILKPYFPYETHALMDDWRFFTLNFLYFLFGYILLSNDDYVKAIFRKRYGMMIMAVISTTLMFLSPRIFPENMISTIWDASSILLSWFLCLSIVGYAQSFLRFNNKLRRIGNEMIYPFYLLHQPVIIILGFFIIQFETTDFIKFVSVLVSSFIFTIALYFLVIRQNKYLRIIFGVKKIVPVKFNIMVVKEKIINPWLKKAS